VLFGFSVLAAFSRSLSRGVVACPHSCAIKMIAMAGSGGAKTGFMGNAHSAAASFLRVHD